MWFKSLFKKENKGPSNLYENALKKCKNNEEMWVVCKDYPNYQVSNMGDVLFTKKGILVSQKETSNGSKVVFMRKENKTITCSVAKLIASSFEIPNEKNKKNVYHINEINNNRLDNLSYDDKYNMLFRSKKLKNEKEYIKMEKEYSDKERIDNELAKPVETKEIWKDVVGYERWYEVSDKGNVRKINDDGSRKILKAKPSSKGKTVGLRKVDKVKTYQVSHLVAEAFKVPTTKSNKNIVYHIDGDMNNDCLSNLTYDKKETEAYKEEQERLLKEEQAKIDTIYNEEKEKNRLELFNYIESNKDFLVQAKEMNKQITLEDVYNKLDEILEVLKRG